MAKTTEWFPPNIKPTHVGIYQVQKVGWGKSVSLGDVMYSHWNGKRWSPQQFLISDIERRKRWKANFQNKTWRGLADKPN